MLLVFGLGLSSPIIVVFALLLGLVIQTQWQRTAVKKDELKRLMILPEEENSRAELEPSFSYSCGSAVAVEPRAQCAVCFFPTTRKCSRCKVVYYCSGRCQIIHWRKGHKDQCHPPAANSNLDWKTGKHAQNVNCTNIFDNGDSIPTTRFHPGSIQTHTKSFAEVSHEKHINDYSAECASISSGASFSGFSGSSGNNEASDDSSSVSISSNDSGKSDRCESNDTEKEMLKTSFTVKDEQQPKSLTPKFARLDNSVNSFSGSVGSDKQSALFSAKRVPGMGSPDNGQLHDDSIVEVSHLKHNYDFSAEFSSISSGASFSGFAGSSGNNEAPDDSFSESTSSNDSGKSDRCGSNDTEKEMVKTSFIVNHEQQTKLLTPKFARLDYSVNSFSGSVASDKQSALFSAKIARLDNSVNGFSGSVASDKQSALFADKRVQRKDSPDNGQLHDDSIVEPLVTSSSFWERALGPEELASGFHASLPPINKGISTRRFSFNSFRSNSIGEEVLHDRVPMKQCNSRSTLVEKLDDDAVLSSLSLNSRKLADRILDHSNDTAVKRSIGAQSAPCVDSTSSSTQIQVSNWQRPIETSIRLRKSVETKPPATIPNQAGMDSGKSVMDQLKRSSTSGQYSLRGADSVGRYDMGLFSYETFVKLYTWKEVELRPSGLINCGNSCYANAVLQCLAFTPPLTAFFLQGLHSKSCTKKDWCFMCEFEGLLLKAKRGESPVSPFGIVSQLQMIGSQLSKGREEDAHEFLRYTVDAMESICLAEHDMGLDSSEADTNLMGLTFGGYLQSKIRCNKCQGKSERQERMMDLTVEIEGSVESLEEALERFTVYETLDGENKYKCSRCGSYEKAKKKLTVSEAPNVLTIALKRFQTGEYGKLNKSIRFPEILNLAPYMSGTSDKSPIYRLYGVIVHLDIMNAAFSGHYICYIKNPQNNWFKIDDSQVTPVDKESVLAAKAYTLMYSRCSPRAPRSIRSKLIMSTELKHRPGTLRSPNGLPSIESFYSNYQQFKRAFEEDSSSDNSSLFSSNSDEGSSTDMTRDSTCSDDLSEFLFGYSPNRNPNSSETSSSSSPLSSPQSKDGGEGKLPFLHPDMTKHSSRKLGSSISNGSFSVNDADVDKLPGVNSGMTYRKTKRV